MKGIGMLLVLMSVALHGCKDLGANAGPDAGFPSAHVLGKFVVDEYIVDCQAKVHPRNDSVQAWFPVTLRYHFEGAPGCVSTMSFMFDKQVGVTLAIDGWPDSANVMRTYSSSYWTSTRMAQQESVLVECTLDGYFVAYVDGVPEIIETWAWKNERNVAVRH